MDLKGGRGTSLAHSAGGDQVDSSSSPTSGKRCCCLPNRTCTISVHWLSLGTEGEAGDAPRPPGRRRTSGRWAYPLPQAGKSGCLPAREGVTGPMESGKLKPSRCFPASIAPPAPLSKMTAKPGRARSGSGSSPYDTESSKTSTWLLPANRSSTIFGAAPPSFE